VSLSLGIFQPVDAAMVCPRPTRSPDGQGCHRAPVCGPGLGVPGGDLAGRIGTTQSVISRLEEGGGARNRIDTLARVATALNRHLVLSFPADVPKKLTDVVQVA